MTHQSQSKLFAATCLNPVAFLFAGILTVLCGVAPMAWAASAVTTTTLAVTSGGGAVTTVESGSVVTLTATVNAGGTAVTRGQVNFCIADAAYCTDNFRLGMAQLTSAGTAVLKFRPEIGTHSYKAAFIGTKSDAGSSSSVSHLSVTGKYPTAATIASSGSPGNYTLTATIPSYRTIASIAHEGVLPTGTVSFLDTSNGNELLGTAMLESGGAGLNWMKSQTALTGAVPAVGDFNGDGIPDLAVVTGANKVTILLGKGDGTFTAGASPATGTNPVSIAVGDFNGDGIPDLAVLNMGDIAHVVYPAGSVTLLLGNGDGTFTATTESPATGMFPESVATGDFNLDGIADLAVANIHDNTVTILLGNGDGTFKAAASPNAYGNPDGIAVGDFNGDGVPDLAVAEDFGDTITILLGNGDGTFKETAGQHTGFRSLFVAVADFNRDGIADLAVNAFPDGPAVMIMLGNGDGTFRLGSMPEWGANMASSFAVGDFNGDGILDLAVPATPSNIWLGKPSRIWLGNGDGTFAAKPMITPGTGNWPGFIAVGDFNGDGEADLAVADTDDGTVTILLAQQAPLATATASGIPIPGWGTHLVEASYPGDSNYGSSVSGTKGLTGVYHGGTHLSHPGQYTPRLQSDLLLQNPGSGVTAYTLTWEPWGPPRATCTTPK